MKRIKKPLNKKFPPVKLYLDDIVSIWEILRQNVESIEVTTTDYEIENIEQMKNLDTNK